MPALQVLLDRKVMPRVARKATRIMTLSSRSIDITIVQLFTFPSDLCSSIGNSVTKIQRPV